MNETILFSKFCEMEAYIQLAKAHHLRKEYDAETQMLINIRTIIIQIFDQNVSGDETKLYIAK